MSDDLQPTQFRLFKPFGIDGEELDGLTPQECFVLGYELAMLDRDLDRKLAIDRPVHAANRERIAKSCRDAKVMFRLLWAADDPSETWMHLIVNQGERDE